MDVAIGQSLSLFPTPFSFGGHYFLPTKIYFHYEHYLNIVLTLKMVIECTLYTQSGHWSLNCPCGVHERQPWHRHERLGGYAAHF